MTKLIFISMFTQTLKRISNMNSKNIYTYFQLEMKLLFRYISWFQYFVFKIHFYASTNSISWKFFLTVITVSQNSKTLAMLWSMIHFQNCKEQMNLEPYCPNMLSAINISDDLISSLHTFNTYNLNMSQFWGYYSRKC